MPAFQIASSTIINAPASKVRDTIADYTTWPTWSPWLIMEPDSKLSYQGEAGVAGHGYQWEGKKVGAGSMVMTSIDANRIESDLEFLKPWKSHADIAFDIVSLEPNKTEVTWGMDSALPFFMFFMLGKMKAMIKADYDRGLLMLKDLVETGSVPSKTVVEGVVDVPASKERPACRALKMVHTGPYRHLGNAWAYGTSEIQNGKMKANKQLPQFEVYVNDPESTSEDALITELYMPVKG